MTAPMIEAGSALPSRPLLLAISHERIEVGAGSNAMREHLTGSSIRIESNGHCEAATVVLELDGFGGTAVGKPGAGHRTPP
jgi:hypothetical protein